MIPSALPDYGADHGGTTFDRPSNARCSGVGARRDGSGSCEAVRGFGGVCGPDRAAAALGPWASSRGRGQVPGKIGGSRRAVLAGESAGWLLARLAEKPDLTMRALTLELAARGVHVAHDTVWRFVKRAGQTVKKRP